MAYLEQSEPIESSFHNYMLIDYINDKLGKNWKEVIINSSLMKYIEDNKLFDDFLKFVFESDKYVQENKDKVKKYIEHIKYKRSIGKNYYEIPNENMQLDKDILIKDNKIYSPKTCIFVPQRINKLFTKRQNDRGLCPIGVTERKNNKYKKFESRCSIGNGKRISLGYFYTKEEAFKAYKEYKEKYIRQIADEYKSKYPNFPQKLYDAMYNYQVWEDD